MKPKLIVIEGSDASGKKTQFDILYKKLKLKKKKIKTIDFPRYDSRFGKVIANYLRGEMGKLETVDPYSISLLYAFDRKEVAGEMHRWIKEGNIVLCNRYVESNKAYQSARFNKKNDRDAFIEWVDEVEYIIHKMPRPDLVIFLYVPLKVSQKLVEKKGYRKYVKGNKKDLHEKNIRYLKKVEEQYLALAKKEKWIIINCVEKNKLLPKEKIAEMIWRRVNGLL